MRYLIIILFSIFTFEVFAQKCDRPEEVYIRLTSIDSATILNCFGKHETRIYLKDSAEVFIRTSELNELTQTEFSELNFSAISDLRSEAGKIRRCEIKKSDDTIYLDININSIFKKYLYDHSFQGKNLQV